MKNVSLANWRKTTFNVWAFRHIDQIIEIEKIAASVSSVLQKARPLDTAALRFEFEDRNWTFADVPSETASDGVIVLHKGEVAHKSY